MKKKAQGISVNTIIIAAIALVVLVVLVAIFSGYFGNWRARLEQTEQVCTSFKTTVEGTEYTAAWQEASCGEKQKEIFTATDASENPGKHCCVTTA